MSVAQRDSSEAAEIRAVADLLGGKEVFNPLPKSELEAHQSLTRGLPRRAVRHFLTHLKGLRGELVTHALGMSLRTTQRHRGAPEKPLTLDQGSRIWMLASLLNRLSQVLGSFDEAQRWIVTPAMALNQMRPIDLLSTAPGRKMVNDLVTRMTYGVYT